MPEKWIVRVQGREYGPVDLQILREWKEEGRVLPKNEARRADADVWITAGEIPELFQATARSGDRFEVQRKHRSFGQICSETFRIYRKGFFHFFCLTLVVVVPSLCAQLTGAILQASPNGDIDLRRLLAMAFAFCMLLLSLGLWPIYISGIQILTAELASGHGGQGFLRLLNHAVKFWTRVAILCVFVYGAYFFWTVLPVGLILVILLGTPSLGSIFLVLVLLAFQVWIVGRLFINFLFWQQFAVLEQSDVANSLQQSKKLARSGRGLRWFQRPLWRGVFIASLWFAFVLAANLGPEWPTIRHYFHELTTTQDPEALLQALRTSAKTHGSNVPSVALGLLQALLRPLLGIAFALLYFDAKSSTPEEGTGD
jgi:hypothetical protein